MPPAFEPNGARGMLTPPTLALSAAGRTADLITEDWCGADPGVTSVVLEASSDSRNHRMLSHRIRSAKLMQSSKTSMTLRSTAILWLTLLLLLVANSADFFFHRPFYEWWDSAANALSVDRAKHFAQLYGAYSRWNFCHPGPALFYLQAWGEWLFYDLLHLSPAPFNAQTLFYLCLSTGLFVVILRRFTHWLPPRAWQLFLPVAIALSALHFIAMGRLTSYDVILGPTALAGVWPVHVVVLPFVCMLIAGASVAAGRGRDLPLLFLCGGFLLHLHVSEPLMVVPLVTLSWLGLVLATTPLAGQTNGPRRWFGKVAATWRNHRRAHLLACVIMAVTALPVLIDVSKGADSNLALILQHMRLYQGEHKSFVRSLLYFLQYGAYTPFIPYTADHLDDMQFGHFDHASAMAYLRAHALTYALWLGGLALLVGAVWRRPSETSEPAEDAPVSGRFFARLCGLLATAIGLSLYWGTIQDGRMYYYNAWFNFGIYGALGLGVAAAAALFFMRTWPAARALSRWPAIIAWTAAIAVCASLAGPLRIRAADPEVNAAMHAGIMRVMAAYAPPEKRATVKILRFGSWYWDGAIAVALQLQRDGNRFIVPEQWGIVFGPRNTWKVYERERPRPAAERWFIDTEPVQDPQLAAVRFPILHNVCKTPVTITVSGDLAVLDPAGSAGVSRILFRKGGNSLEFMVAGWADEELWGRWTQTSTSVLAFRPAPCGDGDDVQLTLDAVPFVLPQHGLPHQRLQLLFNGQQVGEERDISGAEGPVTVRIPARMWNEAARSSDPKVVLEMKMPDATAPHRLDPANPDLRVLGMHFAEVRVAPWDETASANRLSQRASP